MFIMSNCVDICAIWVLKNRFWCIFGQSQSSMTFPEIPEFQNFMIFPRPYHILSSPPLTTNIVILKFSPGEASDPCRGPH